jgi:ankyrin repeat protein
MNFFAIFFIVFLLCLPNNLLTMYAKHLYGDAPLTDLKDKFENDEKRAEYWLPIAAYANNIAMVRKFLAHHPNVNRSQSWWRSGPNLPALQAAVAMGNTEIVGILLEHGANPNYASAEWLIPTQFAFGIDELGLKKPPHWIYDLNKADPTGMSETIITPLMYAAKGGYTDIVKLLLNKDVLTGIKNIGGETAFKYAANQEIKQLITNASRGQKIEKPTIKLSVQVPISPIVLHTPENPAKKSNDLLMHEIQRLSTHLEQLAVELSR